MEITDEKLVDLCRSGDCDAFTEIVRRYQTLVCSIAFGATGNLAASEDLAQEAFVNAWRSLPGLREPHKLRQWLCGIVRNLARKRQQSRGRAGAAQDQSVDWNNLSDGHAGEPAELTIAQEEADLLNRTLAALPEHYREPLVLYYRENKSVARVAEMLELTPDAVKQRLARGRAMLREEVAAVVERGLRHSAPGRAFTIGVLAALPVLSGTAKAAVITASSAKGVGAMNAAGWTGMTGAILGPIAGLIGTWFGYSMSLRAARSERERAFIRRMTLWVLVYAGGLTVGMIQMIRWGVAGVAEHPARLALGIPVLVGGYVVGLLVTILWGNRRLAQIRREDGTVDMPLEEAAAKMPPLVRQLQYPRAFESKRRLFGLPLVSIRIGGANAIGSKPRPAAVGWIAIGDVAYGVLFACGSIAVGGVAAGAVGVGAISFGGLAVGGLALGGGAVGWWSLGGAALGFLAYGGMAVAWKAAMGGMAVAHDYAFGGLGIAEHANDEAAKAFTDEHAFFELGSLIMNPWAPWILVVLVLAPPLLVLKLVPPSHRQ
ncbi:MAG: sigma-70 family RNA polymerase sigma factor [Planctomycetaceae bacterium]|nr:sigma-70 family RNA polymerase sigma factor [Planctomycetaceae bacterium]